ncbi:MarR family winged helix-turn-helix transcriptional regulator [Thermoactinospora rubra]|uniref:MarR family winged helix-turn-helix transcriptional regulator n=1 Tax=Thermoactinospora rubra TaxID=1088767 RepID=UPI000A0FF631|nr:MarR family transcriptional regulator [Thermoactinospora rubra]
MDADLARTVESMRLLIRALDRGKASRRLAEAVGQPLDKPSLHILTYLFEAGEPRRIGAIAEGMQVEGPHVTRNVAALERRGLVSRVQDPADGRAWLIALTPEGYEVTRRCREVTSGWFGEALANWSEEDRAQLSELLARFSADMADTIRKLTD